MCNVEKSGNGGAGDRILSSEMSLTVLMSFNTRSSEKCMEWVVVLVRKSGKSEQEFVTQRREVNGMGGGVGENMRRE